MRGELGVDYCLITGGYSDLTLILSCSLCFHDSNSLVWLSIASRSYDSLPKKKNYVDADGISSLVSEVMEEKGI